MGSPGALITSEGGVPYREAAPRRNLTMWDLLYLGLTAGLFVATIGLIRLLDRV
jgi:hypothetical protein